MGLLLADLVSSKPKDLARAIREFAGRTAMLRECGLRHIGCMLVAMLAVRSTHSDSEHASNEDASNDLAVDTAEKASALGRMLVSMKTGSSEFSAAALRRVVDSQSILCALRMQHSWFLPMLEVLVALPQATVYAGSEQSRTTSTRQLALLTPGAWPNTTELT